MKTWPCLLALLPLLWSPAAVRADIPAPRPKGVEAPLVVMIDDNARQPRLQVPRKLLGTLKASADSPEDTQTGTAGLPHLHTVMAGVALALALAFGGLWLVRHRGHFGGRGLALFLGMVLCGGIGTAVVWANKPISKGDYDKLLGDRSPKPAAGDKVSIEVTPNGDTVRLIVNRAYLAKHLEKPQPK